MFVFVTGVFCYSCDSGAVWSAGCCSAAGRARSESAVPVLCSGFLWADGCSDSDYCEVSFYSYFSFLPIGSLCGFGFSVFLLLLAVVDYLMRRFGFEFSLSKCYFHHIMMI